MLSIAKISNVRYHLSHAQEGREIDASLPGEAPGVWIGKASLFYGLGGKPIEESVLQSLFSGVDLEGCAVVRNADTSSRVPGWDLVFSVPKSVSIYWCLATEEERCVIESLQHLAVQETVQYIEERFGVSLVAASWLHVTNRNLEPQLHTHCQLVNVAINSDKQQRAFNSLPLYRAKLLFGAYYRVTLAVALQEKLQLPLERVQSWFEIKGFSRTDGIFQTLMNHFSSRRRDIEKSLESNFSAAEAQIAAYKTRQHKGQVPPRVALFSHWEQQATLYQVTREMILRAVTGTVSPSLPKTWHRWRVLMEARRKVTLFESHFSEKDVTHALLVAAQGRGLTTDDIKNLAHRFLSSRQVIPLAPLTGDTPRYTMKRLYKQEMMLLKEAKILSGDRERHHFLSRVFLTPKQNALSETQKRALTHLLLGRRLSVITGLPRSGKTETLLAAKDYYLRAGYNVLSVSATAKGQEEHQRSGVSQGITSRILTGARERSMTVDRFLWEVETSKSEKINALFDSRRQGPQSPAHNKTVLFVDDAQEISASKMLKFLYAARKAGATVFLAGDTKARSLTHGGALRAIAKTVGSFSLSAQHPGKGLSITQQISKAQARKVLNQLQQAGHLSVHTKQYDAIRALMATWRRGGGVENPEEHIMIAQADDAYKLNREAQREQQQLVTRSTGVSLSKQERLFSGDRIFITETSKKYGVSQGEFGTIRFIEPLTKHVVISFDSGKRRVLNLRDFSGLTLGYAVAISKTGKIQAANSYTLIKQMDQTQALAALGRASETAQLFLYEGKDESQIRYRVERSMEVDRSKKLSVNPHFLQI